MEIYAWCRFRLPWWAHLCMFLGLTWFVSCLWCEEMDFDGSADLWGDGPMLMQLDASSNTITISSCSLIMA